MYILERTDYGFHLTFGGFIDAEQMQGWLDQSRQELAEVAPPFGVIVDMRTLIPLHPDAQQIMEKGQALYRESGMQRSAVILNHPVTTIQFQRLARQSGISEWERYIDASTDFNWQETARQWVEEGEEPSRS